MLEDKKHAITRNQCRKLVAQILRGREEALVRLSQLSRADRFADGAAPLLDEFCDSLVDYVAIAHFVLYRRLGEGAERRRAVVEVASEVYPAIERSTRMALDFNDRYGGCTTTPVASALKHDLSVLGEALAGRMDLEDRLITAMLGEPYSALGAEE